MGIYTRLTRSLAGKTRATNESCRSSQRAFGLSLKRVLREVRGCRICESELPLGPRPVVQLANTARLLIIGQAPGSKVHQSGIPWNDASGDRLRGWLKLDRSAFFDEARVAILPMGFCYPGAGENGADKPPRPECAPRWHERLVHFLTCSLHFWSNTPIDIIWAQGGRPP